MGLQVSLVRFQEEQLQKRDLLLSHSTRCFHSFPYELVPSSAGDLLCRYHVIPPRSDYRHELNMAPASTLYHVHVHFANRSERKILTSFGAYTVRPGQTPQAMTTRFNGSVFEWDIYAPKKISCHIINKVRVTGYPPSLELHHDDYTLLYSGPYGLTILDLCTMGTINMGKLEMGEVIKSLSYSPDTKWILMLVRLHNEFVIRIVEHHYSFLVDSEVHTKRIFNDHFITLGRSYTENCYAHWSSDSKLIAFATSMGHYCVLKRHGLSVVWSYSPFVVTPALEFGLGGASTCHSIGFIGKTQNDNLTMLVGIGWCVLLGIRCNDGQQPHEQLSFMLPLRQQLWSTNDDSLHETYPDIELISCSRSCNLVAIALSNGTVLLYESCNLLNTSASAVPFTSLFHNTASEELSGICSMNFSDSEELLVTGSRNGYVHVWSLGRDISLRSLASRAVAQQCPVQNIGQLPLPTVYQHRLFMTEYDYNKYSR